MYLPEILPYSLPVPETDTFFFLWCWELNQCRLDKCSATELQPQRSFLFC
jgi:hypothetical protein